MNGDYMLTACGTDGWRDIQVLAAPDMLTAIHLAERETGCMVSHGQGGRWDDGTRPNLVIHADTGQVVHLSDTPARPIVDQGPPDVLALIAAAVRGKPNANHSNNRTNNS